MNAESEKRPHPDRIKHQTGTVWEEIVAYSRAIRVGRIVEVAGTTAVDERGEVVGPDDAAVQARFVFRKIEAALRAVGASLEDVVRTRMFVTRIEDWRAIGEVHGKVFAGVAPVSTLVQVAGLIDPALLVEIEVSAIIGDEI